MNNKKTKSVECIDFSNIPLTDTYNDHIFVIYPFIESEGNSINTNFGSILATKDVWDHLSKLLSGSKCCTSINKVYIYRDLEYCLNSCVGNHDDLDLLVSVTHKKISHVDLRKKYLLIISAHELLDNDSFPKLNSYNDEYEKTVREYKFGTVSLNLVTIKKNNHEYNHIEITFQYKKHMSKTIIKDLDYVKAILNKQFFEY